MTVRVKGIASGTPKESLEAYADALCEAHAAAQKKVFLNLWFLRNSPAPGRRVLSIAPQSGHQTGTITFPGDLRIKFLPTHGGDWTIDDYFIGLTVLYSAVEPELDICALHGFNGNAFDTFASGEHMWLRDFLPSHSRLGKSRTMTYGYSSLLRDGGNIARLEEWAHGLLTEVASVRETPAERSRPIIFVCHSLGGLVAREAMILLARDPHLYEGLELKHCGLLFLGTPHSGATPADWNPYLVQLSELAGLRSRDFTELLGSFNNQSRVSKREFGRLRPLPPYECVYETRRMKVGPREILIVTPDAAGLNDVPAQPMNNVNHTEICRFPSNTHPGYIQVGVCLCRIKDRLAAADAGDAVPGYPGIPLPGPPPNAPLEQHHPETHCQVPNDPAPASESGHLQAGHGEGGVITRNAAGLVIGGGRGTGATANLRDLLDFQGTVQGGTGLGARVAA
jgi:hypothetical protein